MPMASKMLTFTKLMKKPLSLFIPFTILIFLCGSACNLLPQKPKGDIAAEAAGHFLYRDDVTSLIPHGTSTEDSLRFSEQIIKRWATDILMYENAKNNVTKNAAIDSLVETYRKALVMHEYEQHLVSQRMSQTVDETQIKGFYDQYAPTLKLTEEVVKGLLVVVPVNAPYLRDLRKWVAHPDSTALEQIEKYTLQNAVSYDYFMDQWTPFTEIRKLLSTPIERPDEFLKAHGSYIEMEDSVHCCLLHVAEYRVTGDIKPYEYAYPEIEAILLNRRKIEFLQTFKNKLYQDAVANGNVMFYNKEEEK